MTASGVRADLSTGPDLLRVEIREAQHSTISPTGIVAGIRKILRSRQYCHWLAPGFALAFLLPNPPTKSWNVFIHYFAMDKSDQGPTGQSLRRLLLHTVLLPPSELSFSANNYPSGCCGVNGP